MTMRKRTEEIIDLLEKLEEGNLRYVLIGGYAVSAFTPRFSTDLDIVINPENEEEFRDFLEKEGFELKDRHKGEWFYDRVVEEYEKRVEPDLPIGFDLLVNGLGCRQTDAEWSFDYLYKNSIEKEVLAGTRTVEARVCTPEILIAAKLHSGRETDIRDVTALVKDVELKEVTPHLDRGNKEDLEEQLKKALKILDSEELRHGFKSDFGESSAPKESIEKLQKYINRQIEK